MVNGCQYNMHSNNCNDCIAITSLITNARCDPCCNQGRIVTTGDSPSQHTVPPPIPFPPPEFLILTLTISKHCVIYRWNMNMNSATFFLHERSPKDRCPVHPPVLPGVAFPTRWKTNDGQTDQNGCWQEICYWSPTWGNHPIFEVGYIEYLIIDILTIRH